MIPPTGAGSPSSGARRRTTGPGSWLRGAGPSSSISRAASRTARTSSSRSPRAPGPRRRSALALPPRLQTAAGGTERSPLDPHATSRSHRSTLVPKRTEPNCSTSCRSGASPSANSPLRNSVQSPPAREVSAASALCLEVNSAGQGESLGEVQNLVGHADPRSTRLYDSSVAEEAFGNLPSSPAYLSPAFLKAEPSSMNFRC